MGSLEKLGYDRELQILQETSHPFVVKYMEEFVYKDRLCIVTKFASGGDLDTLMKK
jgi:serine/threonine protein kinase